MRKPIYFIERVRNEEHRTDRCWQAGIGTHRSNWVFHVSVGRPVWWLPDVGYKRYSNITEVRFGWLLLAVQIARKPNRWRTK
jgi:hypothetical protein